MNGVTFKPISRCNLEEAVRPHAEADEHFPIAVLVLDLDEVEVTENTDKRIVIKIKPKKPKPKGEKPTEAEGPERRDP